MELPVLLGNLLSVLVIVPKILCQPAISGCAGAIEGLLGQPNAEAPGQHKVWGQSEALWQNGKLHSHGGRIIIGASRNPLAGV